MKLKELMKRREYLEITKEKLDSYKKNSDQTRSVDNSINYLIKKEIKLEYKIK